MSRGKIAGVSKVDDFNSRIWPLADDSREEFKKIVTQLSSLDIFRPSFILLTIWNFSWFQTILRGHGEGEIWGLACHPDRDVFVTASDDQTVRLWDVASKVNTIFVTMNTIGWVIRDL